MDDCPEDDDFDEPEFLIGELRQLARRPVYSPMVAAITTEDAVLLVDEIDRLRLLVPVGKVVNDTGPNCDPDDVPAPVPDDPDMLSEFTDDELPRW